MAFVYKLQINFLETKPPEESTGQLSNYEPCFPVILQDFTDTTSNLDSLAERPNKSNN